MPFVYVRKESMLENYHFTSPLTSPLASRPIIENPYVMHKLPKYCTRRCGLNLLQNTPTHYKKYRLNNSFKYQTILSILSIFYQFIPQQVTRSYLFLIWIYDLYQCNTWCSITNQSLVCHFIQTLSFRYNFHSNLIS